VPADAIEVALDQRTLEQAEAEGLAHHGDERLAGAERRHADRFIAVAAWLRERVQANQRSACRSKSHRWRVRWPEEPLARVGGERDSFSFAGQAQRLVRPAADGAVARP